MSHDHQHSPHAHHGHEPPKKRGIHHDWRFWTAVILMLAAMGIYVATMDEAIGPGSDGQPVPAAAE